MFFHGGGFVLGILFLVVVAPVWIICHYATQWRKARRLKSTGL